MDSNVQVWPQTGSATPQLGSKSALRRAALAPGVHSVSARGERRKVDWLVVAVWTALLSFTAVLWIGLLVTAVFWIAMLALVTSGVR